MIEKYRNKVNLYECPYKGICPDFKTPVSQFLFIQLCFMFTSSKLTTVENFVRKYNLQYIKK